MNNVKSALLDYFEQLNYQLCSQQEEYYHFKQNRTGLEVELDFRLLFDQSLSDCDLTVKKHKKLFVLDAKDIEKIGIEALEAFAEKLSLHCSMVVFEDGYLEQAQKEIWMFLSIDPRNRDVFNESKYYSK
ncbi:hypothetical protein [Vibrio mexicanus]|uniref:hypothetical protein n=1 Tax=Vibrio mexicanus TaxID=1004326 RepID=UPI00063CB4DD|nr:hypothetical protein [Vibrio mexicanus]